MIRKSILTAAAAGLLTLTACQEQYDPIVPLDPVETPEVTYREFIDRAEQTFEAVHRLYWSDKAQMMFGTYPNSLGTGAEPSQPEYNIHAFSWGYGAYVSAFSSIVLHTENKEFRTRHEAEIKATLQRYYNTSKQPECFACFTNPWDNRLYDDAIWIGIDMTDLYGYTKDQWYLDKAKSVYQFVLSGIDHKLGGGVYWDEGARDSKNTCSNAPATVMCAKLYQVTQDAKYLETAKQLYSWTKQNLQDPGDLLYFDNIKLDGTRGTTKFSYNSGQMLQGAVLLYKTTQDAKYLDDARKMADACYRKFFSRFVSPKTGKQFQVLSDGSRWFNAVMVRGFAELNTVEPNNLYTQAIYETMEHAWLYTRDEATGLFMTNYTGTPITDNPGDILAQGATIELFARLSAFKNEPK